MLVRLWLALSLLPQRRPEKRGGSTLLCRKPLLKYGCKGHRKKSSMLRTLIGERFLCRLLHRRLRGRFFHDSLREICISRSIQ